jgi:Ca2+-binding RTX toxin-like protein
VPGSPITFVFSAFDIALDQYDAPYTFTMNWGAGTFTEIKPTSVAPAAPAGRNVEVSFTYDFAGQAFGTYQPTISVVDNDGNPVGTIVLPKIQLAQIVSVGGVLYVGGSDGADRIIVQSASGGGVGIRINGAKPVNFSVSSKVVVFGNGGGDNITTTLSLPVEFYGGAGNDYLAGGGAADLLDGGDDSDRVLGGNGNDTLLGGAGSDTLSGGSGHDWLEGDAYSDFSAPRDVATGFYPLLLPDALMQGNDTLNADAGNDTANGQGGNDRVYGGAGDDSVRGGNGQDMVDGGAGRDLVMGDGGGDTLYGRAASDVLIGGGGVDQLFGYTGADLLYGGDVSDPDDLESLKAVAAIWFANNKQLAADELALLAIDDLDINGHGTADLLSGEADADYYLMYLYDSLKAAAENKTPNKVIPGV